MARSISNPFELYSFLFQSGREQTFRSQSKDLADLIVAISLVGDFIVSLGCLIFSFWVRFGPPLGEIEVQKTVHIFQYANYFISGAALLSFLAAYRGVYQCHSLLRFRITSLNVIQSIGIWFVGFLGATQIMRDELPISRLYVIIATTTMLFGLLGWRYLLNRLLHRSYFADILSEKVLLVGWNTAAANLAEGISRTHTRVYQVKGCLATAEIGATGEDHLTIPTLGVLEDLESVIERHSISMVIVADPALSMQEISGIANLCERELVQFKIAPSCFQILVSGLELQSFNNVPVLGVSRLPLDNFFNVAAKRVVDIAGATFGLLLSLPLIAVFGTIVWLESPGPILYRQKRVGRNGCAFNILKIRSMRLDAEKGSQPGWSTKNDPRRLRIGGFMRKWNIDEVPQFWNVLKGEMSLVGPRPERPELIRNFRDEIPHYQARHNVKPGITGWAQVKGLRGDTDLGERIKCDLFYLENWNLILDLQIMAMTFLGNKNAA